MAVIDFRIINFHICAAFEIPELKETCMVYISDERNVGEIMNGNKVLGAGREY